MPFGPSAKWIHKHLRPENEFARGSFRTIGIGGSKKMIVGCPRGHWSGRRCSVGMRGKTLLMPNYPNNNPRRKMKKRKSKWNVKTAPRRVRLLWLKKAQKMRRYYARCRSKMGISRHRRMPLTTRHTEYKPYSPPSLGPSDLWEGGPEMARSVESKWSPERLADVALNPGLVSQVKPGARVTIVDHDGKLRTGKAVMPSSGGGWVLNMGGRYGTPGIADDSNITRVSSSRARARNPELLVVSNNPGPSQRRSAMRRRRKSTEWSRLVKRWGVKGAKRRYHKHSNRHRRRRRRNSWFGQRARHATAARKGWGGRRRRRGGKARRRKGTRAHRRKGGSRRRGGRRAHGRVKYHGKLWSQKALRHKIGKRRFSKLLKKRGRGSSGRRRFRRGKKCR